ncbi:MAG: hypothetical protein HKO94_03680, partial [Flavobacteriaceae bacterium]|nr:hypothetical protein [Flavobacteriaceae bacterium]
IDGYAHPAKLKLINNFTELENLANNEIGGIITIEGAHALAKYNKDDLFESRNIDALDNAAKAALKGSFINNIQKIKDLDYPPFFITFSHHFNNLLSGHSKSFKDARNKILPGFSNVFDQRKGLNDGFTEFGKDLIRDHLLAKTNGKRRILIDTKHMSLKCRDEYFQIVKNHPDNIPIICSHTAINGISNRAEAARRKDTNKLDHRSYVSRWDINITDEDITDIFDTDGIIGICMHDGRMPGGKFNKLVKQQSNQGNSVRVQRLHTQMFLTNVFHVVRINLEHIEKLNNGNPNPIDPKEAWKTVCLGTDFDGIIDPFDHFNTSATLSRFKARCKDAIRFNFSPIDERKRARIRYVGEYNSKPMGKREFEKLLMGYNPEEIVDMVFYDNLSDFCQKYFNDAYLS